MDSLKPAYLLLWQELSNTKDTNLDAGDKGAASVHHHAAESRASGSSDSIRTQQQHQKGSAGLTQAKTGWQAATSCCFCCCWRSFCCSSSKHCTSAACALASAWMSCFCIVACSLCTFLTSLDLHRQISQVSSYFTRLLSR